MRQRVLHVLAVVALSVRVVDAQTAEGFSAQFIRSVLVRDWDYKMISSGDNFPTVAVQKRHRGELAILLHERLPLSAIRAHFGWSTAELNRRLDELEAAGLIRQNRAGGYVPTVMVMSAGDAVRHIPVFERLVQRSADLIVRRLPEVKRLYTKAAGLSHVPFAEASFFILSDVLLDNWQINAVEAQFLNAERPLRDGSRYYYSIREDIPWDSTESFGVYGNQMRGYGPYTVGVYGNRRIGNPRNFIGLGASEIRRVFGETPETVVAFKREALSHLARAARESTYAIPEHHAEGFEGLGWMQNGRIQIPVLSPVDRALLDDMAALVTDDLVCLLREYRPRLERAYTDSPYGEEVTFEAYFMWWYHLYYSAVTDRLAAQGHLSLPRAGITSYVFVPGSD